MTHSARLMLGHASIQQTQRYLNGTDEESRRGPEVWWNSKAPVWTHFLI